MGLIIIDENSDIWLTLIVMYVISVLLLVVSTIIQFSGGDASFIIGMWVGIWLSTTTIGYILFRTEEKQRKNPAMKRLVQILMEIQRHEEKHGGD